MKKYILLLILLFCASSGMNAQTFSDDNFIYTAAPKKAVQSGNLNTLTKDEVTQSVTYFDGLGRPVQTVAINQGAGGQDIVTPIQYDEFGRQVKEHLPYPVANGGTIYARVPLAQSLSTQQAFYAARYDNTSNPFSEKKLESSPLNRVLKQAAPGNSWAMDGGHEIKLDYQANLTADLVRTYSVTTLLDANGVYAPTLSSSANYPAGELYKNITKDENWISGSNNTTEEFKDKEGHVILKRTYNENLPHDTYYIYDIYGNLTYVLPPKAEGSITGSVLNDLCYQYKYDYRNRLVEKKLPGKGWEYIVYDKLDRPVLTQDANLKSQNKWLFTKYDAFGRPVYTGEYTNAGSRADLQNTVTSHSVLFETKSTSNSINGSIVYYTNNAFPNVNNADINLFTINYYDDYGFDINGGNAESSGGITPITNAKGLATGTKVRILGSSAWTTNVIYYDPKGRVIYNYSKNDFLGVTQKLKSELDFVGLPIQTTTQHIKGSTNITIVDAFSYDHAGRLKKQTQTINGSSPEVIAENSYDELGQLVTKAVGGKGASRLQSVDYTYNIRGWLKGINDSDNANNAITMGTGDLFGFQINYSNPSSGTPLYNGNISQTFWKTQTQDTGLKNYTYSYDALNRLTNAVSQDAGRYNESLSYDKNGNILNLTRKGYTDASATDLGIMDNLAYTYDAGNKLFKVKDSSGSTEGFKDGIDTVQEYTYDANGNMKTDGNKGITAISYNHLNLPVDVTLPGGTIHYDYDASGVKQRKVVSGITTDYANGFQYEKLGSGNFVLKFFPTAEGYVNHNNGIFEYIYQYKDHLGNVRLSYKDVSATPTPSLQIVETNHYYPFGLEQKIVGEVNNQSGYKYKYNNKELQDELGLNVYDYGMRNYDATLGKFFNMDRFSEKYYDVNPYQYCVNNPVRFVDVRGDSISVDKSITQNWALNKVMTLFAGTKAGRKFLSQFASKGQTVFGQTFDKDGKYDKAGLNLEFTSYREEDENDRGETGNDGENTITVGINSFEGVASQDGKSYNYDNPNAVTSAKNMSRWIMSRTITAFHESFIHADLFAKDYMDNKKFDSSNILYKPKGYESHWQHSQVLYNNGNNTSWPTDGVSGIKEVNSTFGRFYTSGQLDKMVWKYNGGKY